LKTVAEETIRMCLKRAIALGSLAVVESDRRIWIFNTLPSSLLTNQCLQLPFRFQQPVTVTIMPCINPV